MSCPKKNRAMSCKNESRVKCHVKKESQTACQVSCKKKLRPRVKCHVRCQGKNKNEREGVKCDVKKEKSRAVCQVSIRRCAMTSRVLKNAGGTAGTAAV